MRTAETGEEIRLSELGFRRLAARSRTTPAGTEIRRRPTVLRPQGLSVCRDRHFRRPSRLVASLATVNSSCDRVSFCYGPISQMIIVSRQGSCPARRSRNCIIGSPLGVVANWHGKRAERPAEPVSGRMPPQRHRPGVSGSEHSGRSARQPHRPPRPVGAARSGERPFRPPRNDGRQGTSISEVVRQAGRADRSRVKIESAPNLNAAKGLRTGGPNGLGSTRDNQWVAVQAFATRTPEPRMVAFAVAYLE